MAQGLINESTMQSIADDARRIGAVPKYVYPLREIPAQVFTTPNVTSPTDPTPTGPHKSYESFQIDLSNIEGAVKVEFEVEVGIYENSETEESLIDEFIAYAVAGDGSGKFTSEQIYRNTTSFNLVWPHSNCCNFSFYDTDESGQLDWCGLIVKVYALDSEDNRILLPNAEPAIYTPSEIAEGLANSLVLLPTEAFAFTGDISRLNWGGNWDWFFNQYGEQITMTDITSLNYTFTGATTIERFPFVFNIKDCSSLEPTFENMFALKECPVIRGTLMGSTLLSFNNVVYNCQNIRDFNPLFEPEMLEVFSLINITGSFSCAKPASFSGCYSMRQVPEWWYKFRLKEESTAYPYTSYCLYYNAFNSCYCLDEALNIPVWNCATAQTSDMFNNFTSLNHRLKDLTFETNEGGAPKVTSWKAQTINLSRSAGSVSSAYRSRILDYNSGITADKEVTDQESYERLKNDPDWFTTDVNYSRYNHDSAVRTINSLPDTSAYLATAGGTNTIKFTGNQGALTDGGAINTLTAEEIAVATAKGWTVTLS